MSVFMSSFEISLTEWTFGLCFQPFEDARLMVDMLALGHHETCLIFHLVHAYGTIVVLIEHWVYL